MVNVCIKGVSKRHPERISPPPGTLPSCDGRSQGVTISPAAGVDRSVSDSGRGGTFIPVEDDVSIYVAYIYIYIYIFNEQCLHVCLANNRT